MIHNWLREVRDTLRHELTDEEVSDRLRSILVRPDGNPTATAGIIFISVHSGSIVSSVQNTGLMFEETYEIICTVSQRVRHVPEDRDGDAIFLNTTRVLSNTARKVARLVSNSVSMFDRVRTAVTLEDASSGVVEPLMLSLISPPTPRYKDWYSSTDTYDGDRQPAGYSVDVVFTGGKVITGVEC